MPSKVDTSYRTWPAADLVAMRTSVLIELKQIEGVGQSHAMNGRNVSMPDFNALTEKLSSINAAIAWQANLANSGNKGYASRYASFTSCG